jgi:hypothetical protein
MSESLAKIPLEYEPSEEKLEDIEGLDSFNIVLVLDKSGEILDAKVNTPITGFNPDIASKYFAILSWMVSSTAKLIGDSKPQEIDIVLNDKLIVMLTDGNTIRVGISSK